MSALEFDAVQLWAAVPPADCFILGWVIRFGLEPETSVQTPVLKISAGQRLAVALPDGVAGFVARIQTEDGRSRSLPFSKVPR